MSFFVHKDVIDQKWLLHALGRTRDRMISPSHLRSIDAARARAIGSHRTNNTSTKSHSNRCHSHWSTQSRSPSISAQLYIHESVWIIRSNSIAKTNSALTTTIEQIWQQHLCDSLHSFSHHASSLQDNWISSLPYATTTQCQQFFKFDSCQQFHICHVLVSSPTLTVFESVKIDQTCKRCVARCFSSLEALPSENLIGLLALYFLHETEYGKYH